MGSEEGFLLTPELVFYAWGLTWTWGQKNAFFWPLLWSLNLNLGSDEGFHLTPELEPEHGVW